MYVRCTLLYTVSLSPLCPTPSSPPLIVSVNVEIIVNGTVHVNANATVICSVDANANVSGNVDVSMCVGWDDGPDGGIRARTQGRSGRVVETWCQRRPTKYGRAHGSHVRLQREKPGNTPDSSLTQSLCVSFDRWHPRFGCKVVNGVTVGYLVGNMFWHVFHCSSKRVITQSSSSYVIIITWLQQFEAT